MANPEHLAKLKEGVEAWNEWRQENLGAVPNLRGALLVSVRLDGADLAGADLYRATLSGAHLEGTLLANADLVDADLMGAYLLKADLSGANLKGAKLGVADLRRANLGSANLTLAQIRFTRLGGADLTDATTDDTLFSATDLSGVSGLDSVRHLGPSTIGIDTVYRSRGKIPEAFLRGCGVPDEFIAFAKSLATSPIQFYSCFISYSTKDQDFADRLYADLQNKGVRCWFAPHDVQGGRKLHEQIDEAIRLHDKLLLILSPHSMESEWVKTEIAKARKREVRDQRRVLFPIRLAPFETLRDWECFDADTGKDSAREIREYFIPDFSNWKDHDSYQEAFQRLIGDLKASDAKAK
jgi:hypothetical protein